MNNTVHCHLRITHGQMKHLSIVFSIYDWACNHVGAKNLPILLFFLYHNLITVYANKVKSFLLMQKLIGFLLQFTDTGYYNHNYRY